MKPSAKHVRLLQRRKIRWLFAVVVVAFTFSLASAQVVDALEYYFDNDPGFGNGTPITIPPAESLQVNLTSFVPLTTGGVHTLYVRARQNGVWGLPGVHRFWSEPTAPGVPSITRLEYYLDNDPGVGSGMPLTLIGHDSTTRSLTVPLTNLSPGFHWLYFRALDSYGGVSLPLPRPLWVEAVEYNRSMVNEVGVFFDTDNGPDSDQIIPLVPSDSLTANLIVSLENLTPGYHNMGIRIRDAVGKWSLPYMNRVLVLAPPDAPQFLVISYSDGDAILTWSLPTVQMDSFRIYRSTDGMFTPPANGTLIATVDGTTSTFTDTNVDGEFYYRVTAYTVDE
ncbi:MAG: hypothetical protein OEM52_03655 [bacterium]|nr:hypothetical protein [bacterium]